MRVKAPFSTAGAERASIEILKLCGWRALRGPPGAEPSHLPKPRSSRGRLTKSIRAAATYV